MTTKDFDYQAYLASREWAVKREAVRRRSGNRCERCYKAPQHAVHHLTYANKGNEPLEDLQAICNPCHEFVSGKSSRDPVTQYSGYLAGRFTNPDWRRDLVEIDPRMPDYLHNLSASGGFLEDHFLSSPHIFWMLRHGFAFIGPWKVNQETHEPSGHGILSGGHGTGQFCSCCNGYRVVRACKRAIQACDFVFSWIPDLETGDAPGTLWELGFASALNKPVFLACEDHHYEDSWFVYTAVDYFIPTTSPDAAWDRFASEYWPRHLKNTYRKVPF